jgi:hypothetical protein
MHMCGIANEGRRFKFTTLPTPRGRGPGIAAHVLSVAVYAILALALFSGIWPDPATAYVGVGSDPKQFIWFLTWVPYALSHHKNPLVTDWIFSQSGVNLAWNTAVPFIGVVMAPITWTAGPVLSYDVAMVLGLVASAWAAYYAARRLFGCRYFAALLTGFVYGFSPFAIAHASGHLHLTVAFTPPLFLLMLHDVFVTQRHSPWINGAKLGALACIQYFISPEVLLTVGLLASLGACVLAVSCRRDLSYSRVTYAVRTIFLTILFALPLLSYPLYLMLLGPWQPHHPLHPRPSVFAAGPFTADLASFVIPTAGQAIAPAPFRLTPFAELNTYLGIPLLILLVVISRVGRSDRSVQFLFVVLLGVLLFSLGSSLHAGGRVFGEIPLPWRFLERAPFFQDVLPTRFGEYAYLLAGLILALYISERTISSGRRSARFAAGLVAVIFLLPRVPLPYPANRVELPEIFRLPLAGQDIESPVLVVPFARRGHSTAMLWQAEADLAFKMPEGYAFGPGGYLEPAPTPLSNALTEIEDSARAPAATPELRAEIIGTLRQQRIKTVLLGPSPHEPEALDFLVQILGWAPDSSHGVFVWRHIDRRIR